MTDQPSIWKRAIRWTCNWAATDRGPGCGHAPNRDACTAPRAHRAGPQRQPSWGRIATTCKEKEIFEQPRAIADTLEGVEGIVPELFDGAQAAMASRLRCPMARVQGNRQRLDPACGTSYYSGCTLPNTGFEEIAGIPTQVEMASEYRYRTSVPNPRTLVVTISQSGETADTHNALRHAQSWACNTLTICNVATSAMVRECKLAYITRAGVRLAWPAPKPSPRSWQACSC